MADRLGLQEEGKFKDNINLKIIGPAGSTRLQQMVAELETFDQQLAGLEIYSATATMDDSLLLATIGAAKTDERAAADSPEKQVISKFAEKGITFTRTINQYQDQLKVTEKKIWQTASAKSEAMDHPSLICQMASGISPEAGQHRVNKTCAYSGGLNVKAPNSEVSSSANSSRSAFPYAARTAP
ncbi:MAG: hypothetical protein L6365_10945 [Desulfobulbaceae bacterium]|nr:hypothetical protein [Desulfobulbaceae bacterium]